MVLTFESVQEILNCDHLNEIYRVAIFCVMLYNYVILIFESLNAILKLSESYWTVLSCDTVYYVEQRGSDFWISG